MPLNLVIGTSHKTYLGYKQTQDWCQQVAKILQQQPETLRSQLQLFTFPAMPAVSTALHHFTDTNMAVGAQNLCAAPCGPWTGESSAAMLQEMGCRYVEIGHAERRQHFAETPTIINQKIDMAFANHLTPVICIGENHRMSAEDAAIFAINEIDGLLSHRQTQSLPPAIFAWEPQWAIGASQPASDSYIRYVGKTVRTYLHQNYGSQFQVIYGGSAGPGLLSRLWPDVDGIFLGRFAHHPQAFAAILAEAQTLLSQNSGDEYQPL